MNDQHQIHDDERFLTPFITATRKSVAPEAISDAAERMRQRLPQAPARRAPRKQPRFAMLAVFIAGLAASLPFMIPGGTGIAFADIQQWFNNYETLSVHTQIKMNDNVMVDVKALASIDGNARIEQAGNVFIVNAGNETFTTLLPGQRFMTQDIAMDTGSNEGLDWVEKLSDFRGEAMLIDDLRIIDGQSAIGHRLVIDGVDLTLWSDATTDQPILLEGELPGGLQLETRFEFNLALTPDLFVVPNGYTPLSEG
ncbi:MAG: hypothetical protein AB8F65_12875 [Woeseiaceae bacterium]